MPTHKSAAKRVKQNEKRRLRNRHVVSTLRTLLKKARGSVEKKDTAGAEATVPAAIRALSRAADKGVIHRNQASRKIGRLMKAANAAAKAAQ